MRRSTLIAVAVATSLAAISATSAQSSAGYQVSDQVINSGGTPDGVSSPQSSSFYVELSSIGEALVAVPASSAGYSVESGFSPGYIPAGEVIQLEFVSRDTLQWSQDRAALSYSLLRDDLPATSSNLGNCLQSGFSETTATDVTVPTAGSGFLYLVTSRDRLGRDGALGDTGAGEPRAAQTPCP